MIKINFSYKYLLFLLTLIALISFSEIGNSAPGAVNRNVACATPIVVGTDCEAQPTTQIITFHKVALCTALPTEPTITSAAGLASCSTVFTNTAGAAVSVIKGEGVSPTGTFTDPPYGNYTFAYVEISPVLTYKANLVFANEISSPNIEGTGVTGTGVNCQTNATEYNHFRDSGSAQNLVNGLTCQDTGAQTASNNTVTLNSLNPDGNLFSGRFPGTNGNTDVYLITSTGALAASSAEVAKVIAFVPMTANITPDTTSYDLRYNNTRGLSVYYSTVAVGNSTAPVVGVSVAYFDLTITVQ